MDFILYLVNCRKATEGFELRTGYYGEHDRLIGYPSSAARYTVENVGRAMQNLFASVDPEEIHVRQW
jgi:hypothetical protein